MFGQHPAGVRTRSPAMQEALEQCRMYARIRRPVVLLGPVGSGKTALAGYLHETSGAKGSFVVVSPAGTPDGLFTDLLFGHLQGAFTDASKPREGALSRAAGGTLLLDDAAQLSIAGQSALLRVLDRGLFWQLGASGERSAACRFVIASTEDPAELVHAKRMLPDFASRLGSFVVRVPSLAERREDILPLAQSFAEAFLVEHGMSGSVCIAEDAAQVLLRCEWPENVRQLRAVVERATAHAYCVDGDTCIRAAHFPKVTVDPVRAKRSSRSKVEDDVILRMLEEVGGNKSEAARRLGMHRNSLSRRLG